MLIQENKTRRKLRSGEVVIGAFVTIPAPALVEVCGLAGFDYVIIDAEHGPIEVSGAEDMIRAAELIGITPIVRVPNHDPKTILRFLDAGAQGVMTPQVNSAADAMKIVNAVKYAPVGKRGIGVPRAAAYGQAVSQKEYAQRANEETMIIAQLEHIDALPELPGILAVDRIDGFEIGLADLAQSMGFIGETSRPEVQSVVNQFVAGVLAAGRVLGDTANDAQTARALLTQGYRMIDCGLVAVTTRALRDLAGRIRAG